MAVVPGLRTRFLAQGHRFIPARSRPDGRQDARTKVPGP